MLRRRRVSVRPPLPYARHARQSGHPGGFEFIFGIVKQPGFTIRGFWAGDQDGAFEVDTHHVLADGTEARFPQVFVFEIGDGLIQRFQAYTPYPPPAAPAAGAAPA